MNHALKTLVIACVVAFFGFAVTWQSQHYDDMQETWPSSISTTLFRGQKLSSITNIIERDKQIYPASGGMRNIDMRLPKDAHIFMVDMTGPTNYDKIGQYFWMAYYLFPREVGTSLDHVTRQTKDGFVGTTSESDAEIISHGFDFRTDVIADSTTTKPLVAFPSIDPVNPDWFDSDSDLVIAFLLPLLTALAGLWLFRLLFPMLNAQMPMLEQLAYGLGLGMLAVAALTLGIKLCGFHGRGLILILTAVGAIAELYRDRKVLLTKFTSGFSKLIRRPIPAIFVLIGSVVFLVLFRIAGLEGLMDGDAMRWMLKVKIMYLYTGRELVHGFSNPAFAHTHLDYPTLVPSLHSATYDSIGHVDEFVTKFWPVWMLLFLVAALASLTRAPKGWFHVPLFGFLGLLLLPAIQKYVQWEGSTLPMIFFTTLGFVQCSIWLIRKERARLGLGLTLLFGAAMTKFEGGIFLALVLGWILLLPSARPPLKPSPRVWLVLGFCFLAALPFICLRLQIPVLNYESGHLGDFLHHPVALFKALPDWFGIFFVELARLFVNPDFANWNGEGGQFHWNGQWNGLSSLYNPSTLGLAWLCLLLTVVFWFSVRARRPVIVWLLIMLLGATVAITGIFVTFVSIEGLSLAITYTNDEAGGRYLLPVLLAWFATLMTLLFAEVVEFDPARRRVPAPIAPKKTPPKKGKRKRR